MIFKSDLPENRLIDHAGKEKQESPTGFRPKGGGISRLSYRGEETGDEIREMPNRKRDLQDRRLRQSTRRGFRVHFCDFDVDLHR